MVTIALTGVLLAVDGIALKAASNAWLVRRWQIKLRAMLLPRP